MAGSPSSSSCCRFKLQVAFASFTGYGCHPRRAMLGQRGTLVRHELPGMLGFIRPRHYAHSLRIQVQRGGMLMASDAQTP